MTSFKRKLKTFISIIILLAVMGGNGFLLLRIFEKQLNLRHNAEASLHSVTLDIRTGEIVGDSPIKLGDKSLNISSNFHALPSSQPIQNTPPIGQLPKLDNKLTGVNGANSGLDDPNQPSQDQKMKVGLAYRSPVIAILVTDVGLSASVVPAVLSLPSEINIGLSPYANDIMSLANKLKSLGHSLFMNLPLEPRNYPIDDPGQFALLASLSDTENVDHLRILTSIAPHVAGMYTKSEERFTLVEKNSKTIFDYLLDKNLLYLYAASTENVAIDQYANKYKFPILYSDLTLDTELTDEFIINKLFELEAKAKTNGFAIAVANPYPITLTILNKWIATLALKNIRLVKLDQLYQVLNS